MPDAPLSRLLLRSDILCGVLAVWSSCCSSFDRTVEGDVAAALWAARAGEPYPVIDFTGTALKYDLFSFCCILMCANRFVSQC